MNRKEIKCNMATNNNNNNDISDIELKNLAAHVQFSKQRHEVINEKLDKLDKTMLGIDKKIKDLDQKHIDDIDEIKHDYKEEINTVREQNAENNSATVKIFVGAASTVLAGILSIVVVLLVAYI